MDRAILMSALGRMVSVGLDSLHAGVIEERKRGHSSIAFDSDFRKIGR